VPINRLSVQHSDIIDLYLDTCHSNEVTQRSESVLYKECCAMGGCGEQATSGAKTTGFQ